MEKQGALNSETDSQAVKEAAARNKSVIKSMCLHMAHDCNLRCKYCFASTGDFHGERSLMPENVATVSYTHLRKELHYLAGRRYLFTPSA